MRCNSLQSSTEVANAPPAPDVQPLQRSRHQRDNKTQSDFAGGDFKSSGSASCRSSWSVFLRSALPRMGPGSLLLPACVIICSNVLCPVVAFLYNNRYAGWVKTPPFISGALQSLSAHTLLEKRTVERVHDRFSLIRVGYLTDGTKGSRRGSCLRHNKMFSVHLCCPMLFRVRPCGSDGGRFTWMTHSHQLCFIRTGKIIDIKSACTSLYMFTRTSDTSSLKKSALIWTLGDHREEMLSIVCNYRYNHVAKYRESMSLARIYGLFFLKRLVAWQCGAYFWCSTSFAPHQKPKPSWYVSVWEDQTSESRHCWD